MLSAPADPQSTQPVTPSCRQIRAPSATRAAWVWMSIRPGATILPRASMVSAASPLMSASTAATLPATIATSRTASSPTDGSITRPPLMTRSYVRCRHLTNAGERRGRCAEELAPIHHGPPFPNIDDGCNLYYKVRAERHEPCVRRKQQLLLFVARQLTQNLSNHRNTRGGNDEK